MSIFQDSADAVIDGIASAHGQTIVLCLESGDVTMQDADGNPTAFMRKRPIDWPSPDGGMTGSGWQIVCKGWEINPDDVDSISGHSATVNGTNYHIIAATQKTNGVMILDIGYANA